MKYRYIDVDDAPTAKPAESAARQQLAKLIQALEPGKVAVVTPETTVAIRGTKNRITRAGLREDRPVKVWDVDGKIYVSLR